MTKEKTRLEKTKRRGGIMVKCLLTLLLLVAGCSFVGGWYLGVKYGVGNLCAEMQYYYPDHLPVRGCGEKGDGSFIKPAGGKVNLKSKDENHE